MKKRAIIIVAALLALLAAQGFTTVAAESEPHWDEGHSTFTAGALTATFEGDRPTIKFYLSTDASHTEYTVRFKRIIEFNDTSGKGIFLHNESLKQAELEVDNWNPQMYQLKDSAGKVIGIGVNFTDNVRIEDTPYSVPVTFVAKAYNTTQTVMLNGQSMTIEQAEIKIDFIVSNWPWGTESKPRLALQVNLHSDQQQFEADEGDGTHTITSPQTSIPSEQQFHETSDVEQEIHFSGTVGTTGLIGFFRFTNTATVNKTTPVPVLASYRGESESEDGGNQTQLAIFLSYPYFKGTLDHDPSIGFASAGIPLLWYVVGGAAIVAVGIVVLLRRTRPRIQVASL